MFEHHTQPLLSRVHFALRLARSMITEILVQSEEHVDWLESQLDCISKMGLEIYLGHQMGEFEELAH